MERIERERLKYRRQYILSPSPVDCPFLHNTIELAGDYILYAHIDLISTVVELDHRKLVLLGDMFDYRMPNKGNLDILADLVVLDFNSILSRIGAYSGRFVLVIQEGNTIRLLHDATAARKVFYCKWKSSVYIASQPHLLASLLGMNPTDNQEKLSYYNSPEFVSLFNSNIGDTTLYDEIRQLMPNHFFEINSFQKKRYWPDKKIEFQAVEQVARKCANMIEGYMLSISKRYKVILPVTAGKDSRILLAASKSFREEVIYYINAVNRISKTSPDILIPGKLLAKLGLKFHVLDPYGDVDTDFRKLYFENNSYASTEFLPLIHNYYQKYSERINLPGNIASAEFELYLGQKKNITGKNLARWNGVEDFEYAVDFYNQWISDCLELCRSSNINVLNLFYWEERLGNWGTQIQLEKDIAQEDINPYNSRDLAILYASVKPKYILAPNFILHKRIMKILWPQVLSVPINPGRRMRLLKLLQPLGILYLYQRLRYSGINKY